MSFSSCTHLSIHLYFQLVEDFINDTYTHRFEEIPTAGTVKFIFSIITSIFCIGGMVGALMTAFVSEKFGRKGGLLMINFLVVIAVLLMSFAKVN